MKQKDTSEKLRNMAKGAERENRKAQGFFDGRFRPKCVPNKKKEKELRDSRNGKITEND